MTQIAKALKRPLTTILNLVRRYKLNGHVHNMKREGRPRKATARDLRHLERVVKENRRKPAKTIAPEWSKACPKSFSQTTARRRLKDMGYHGRAARKKPFISESNRRKRVCWAKEHIRKTVEDWSNVVFTDESCIKLSGSDGRVFVWRKTTEEWLPVCTLGTVKQGEAAIMIWGAMTSSGVGPLTFLEGKINGEKYKETLEKHFLSLAAERGRHGMSLFCKMTMLLYTERGRWRSGRPNMASHPWTGRRRAQI